MLPSINILGREINTYGIWALIGIVIGSIVAIFYFSKFNNVKKDDTFYAILYAAIGMAIGSKLLYIITIIPTLIKNYQILDWSSTIKAMLQGGFVFYGGLIGSVLGIYIYSKQFKVPFKNLILTTFPAFPLVHAFARIGCLFAGCCYGVEYHGFGSIVFHGSTYAPNDVELFPTQIVESICNIVIFIILFVQYKKFLGTYKIIGLYCILYSVIRFILEFFRGDSLRGFLFGLSTSQWISIIVFFIGIYIFYKEHKKAIIKSDCS